MVAYGGGRGAPGWVGSPAEHARERVAYPAPVESEQMSESGGVCCSNGAHGLLTCSAERSAQPAPICHVGKQ